MSQVEYKIDESLLKRIQDDNILAQSILTEYFNAMIDNPSNKTNQDFHRHFATRLIRAIENTPNNKDDLN